MISDYADLLGKVATYTGRDDFTHMFPFFVKACEARIRRDLRSMDMETRATITTDATGSATLPTGFIEMLSLKDATTGRVLKAASQDAVDRLYGDNSGTATVYTVTRHPWTNGSTRLTARPSQTGDFAARYLSAPESITTAVGGSNAVLAAYPMIYLYGVCAEVWGWAAANGKDQEGSAKSASASKLCAAEIEAANTLTGRAKLANSRVVLPGVTP